MNFKPRFHLITLCLTVIVMSGVLMANVTPTQYTTGYGIGSGGIRIPAKIYEYGWPSMAFWTRPEKIKELSVTIQSGPIREGWNVNGILIDLGVFLLIAFFFFTLFEYFYAVLQNKNKQR